MYLGCLFYLFVYVELFCTHLKRSELYLFPCSINCQTQVKRCCTLAVISVLILGQTALADVSLPITAVSFPKEVIPVEAGKIEFWAKLSGFAGSIEVGGFDPHFFQIHDGSSTIHAGFNANDGVAKGVVTSPMASPRNDEETSYPCGNVESK
jgi:hypothetical protein